MLDFISLKQCVALEMEWGRAIEWLYSSSLPWRGVMKIGEKSWQAICIADCMIDLRVTPKGSWINLMSCTYFNAFIFFLLYIHKLVTRLFISWLPSCSRLSFSHTIKNTLLHYTFPSFFTPLPPYILSSPFPSLHSPALTSPPHPSPPGTER